MPTGREDEAIWSGSGDCALLGTGSHWFDGRGFFLNRVLGEEIADVDDPRLAAIEREQLQGAQTALEGIDDMSKSCVFELPLDDPRSTVGESANVGAVGLDALNHDPDGLRSALLTTFDLIDDVPWLQRELKLRRELPLTVCTHAWLGRTKSRDEMVAGLKSSFLDVVVHFPNCPDVPPAGEISPGAFSAMHPKLMLFEFDDRLRVVVSSANLNSVHWDFRNEVVWVQDFPCVTLGEDVQKKCSSEAHHLLTGGPFAQALGHFVACLLANSLKGRQLFWVRKLASFDLRTDAKLLISSPGFFCRSPQLRPGSLSLRLFAFSTADSVTDGSSHVCYLERRYHGGWILRSKESGRLLGHLSNISVEALGAAENLGFTVRVEALLLPVGSEELKRWDKTEARQNDHDDIGLLERCANHVIDLVQRLKRTLVGETRTALVVRATIDGSCTTRWNDNLPALLRCIEVNYGVFALEEYLSQQVWLQSEERQYAVMSSAITWPNDVWLEDLDRAVGASQLPAGPQIIVPGGTDPIDASYAEYERRGQLADCSPPEHAAGREQIRNHGKIFFRHFWNQQDLSPYGWILLGSHNFTKAAWGELVCEEPSPDRLWISNRELSILLVEPRSRPERTDAPCFFGKSPLPFGLPLLPADIGHRQLIEAWDTWEFGNFDNDWQWQQSWSSHDWEDADDLEDLHLDWRLKKSSWWWLVS